MSRAKLLRHAGALASGWAVLFDAPSLAAACNVCNPGLEDPAQFGFLMGTLLLSSMPLVLIGGLCWFLLRRARRIAADEASGVIHVADRRPSRSPAPGSPQPVAR